MEGIVRGPSATGPIPTVNAVVLAALPVALVVGCLLIARYVDGARPFWDIAVVGFYGLVVAFPGYAGLVAARSATPAPVAVLSATAPTLAIAAYAFRSRSFRGIEPTAPFTITSMGLIATVALFVAVLAGVWVARINTGSGHAGRGFVLGFLVQTLIIAPVAFFAILLTVGTT